MGWCVYTPSSRWYACVMIMSLRQGITLWFIHSYHFEIEKGLSYVVYVCKLVDMIGVWLYDWVDFCMTIYIWITVCCLYVYEPNYKGIYVCVLVCEHTYVVVHVWQRFITWVHNYMFLPRMFIS